MFPVQSMRHRRWAAAGAALVAALAIATDPARAEGPYDPVGVQHVLLVPVEYRAPFCSSPKDPSCPASGTFGNFGPPRETAAHWLDFYSTEVGKFYRAA